MPIIKDINKGNDEIIRVEVTEFKGSKYLNLRVWYKDKETGEFKPSQKGIAIKPDLYPELKDAISAAETALKES